ncbi:MAG: TonB-dependent receptor [Bacteroidia bacterium]|nr:TonB-dependent receptor [Bacteroidia bacterium]
MKKILFMLLACIYLHSTAQHITVLDMVTRQPIPGVVAHTSDSKISSTSNSKGEIQLSLFKNTDTIHFLHIGYTKKSIGYAQLENSKFKVELKESNISLSEIVVSANRWEENKTENPNRVEKINMKDMAFQNPQTAADLLGAGSSAFVQKSQQAGGSPMLRGFATNRVMIVVDGVRMNNAIFRSGNVQNVISVDPNALDEAEVLFGPGAVMYGSDAIGGVMDFHTKDARLSDTNKIRFNVNAMARYATANKENTGHLDFNIGFKKVALLSSFTFAKYDDLMAGTNDGDTSYLRPTYQIVKDNKDTQVVNSNPSLQVNSKYSQINFMQKIIFSPSKRIKIDYGFHYSESTDAPRYDRLITDADKNGKLDFSEWYYGPQIWQMHRLGFMHNGDNILYNNLRIVAAYQYFEESRHDRRFNSTGSTTSGAARLRHQFEKLDAYSLNIDLDKKIGTRTTLFYGGEFVLNKVGSNSYRENVYTGFEEKLNPRYPDGSTWQTAGAYLSMKHKVNEKIILSAGVRYSYYNITAKFDTTLFKYPMTEAKMSNGAVNGSMGFVYTPIKTFQVYLNASTGFRSPNIDDVGKVFDSQPGIVVVPNPNLKPEYAYSGELGFATTVKNFLKLDAAFYYTYLSNALVRRPYKLNGADSVLYNNQMSQVQALQNASHAYVYGIQSGIEIYFGYGISIRNNITWQVGRENSLDSSRYYPLTHSSPLFGNTHLTYSRKMIKADFYVNYNGAMTYEDLALSERLEPTVYAKDASGKPYVPSWYTLNFKLAFYASKYLAISAGVENITDNLYRPYASGISAPGRNFILSLRFKL